jgi:hypothetical protein
MTLRESLTSPDNVLPLASASSSTLFQEGIRRMTPATPPVSTALSWEERYPLHFTFKPNHALLAFERIQDDKRDPVIIDVSTSADLAKYAESNKVALERLNAIFGEYGFTHPDAGEIIATFGGRGHAFEIRDKGANIYMFFPQPGGRSTIIEFKLSLDDRGERRLSVQDFGSCNIWQKPPFTVVEHMTRELAKPGVNSHTLKISGVLGGGSVVIEDDGEVTQVLH